MYSLVPTTFTTPSNFFKRYYVNRIKDPTIINGYICLKFDVQIRNQICSEINKCLSFQRFQPICVRAPECDFGHPHGDSTVKTHSEDARR